MKGANTAWWDLYKSNQGHGGSVSAKIKLTHQVQCKIALTEQFLASINDFFSHLKKLSERAIEKKCSHSRILAILPRQKQKTWLETFLTWWYVELALSKPLKEIYMYEPTELGTNNGRHDKGCLRRPEARVSCPLLIFKAALVNTNQIAACQDVPPRRPPQGSGTQHSSLRAHLCGKKHPGRTNERTHSALKIGVWGTFCTRPMLFYTWLF